MGRLRTGAARIAVALTSGALVGVLATGCSSGAGSVPLQGVDTLVVPTPSPDPGDFVADVDNPWLAYADGATRTYDVEVAGIEGTRTVTVSGAGPQVAGVGTTSVTSRTTAGDLVESTTDLIAQDRDGNVWWFGREGEWQAGVDGALAGLLMPAEPRLGDGWRLAAPDDASGPRATVVALDAGVLRLRVVLDPDGPILDRVHQRGTGLVEEVPVTPGAVPALLVDEPATARGAAGSPSE